MEGQNVRKSKKFQALFENQQDLFCNSSSNFTSFIKMSFPDHQVLFVQSSMCFPMPPGKAENVP